MTATFSLVEDRTTVDPHDFTDVFYVLDLYHSWNSAQGGLTQNQQQHKISMGYLIELFTEFTKATNAREVDIDTMSSMSSHGTVYLLN